MNIERRPNRLKSYDYNQQGYYYLTICTKNRMESFGNISNGKMHLSTMGLIADDYWKAIMIHFEKIELDEYIIMPDHIHGIIIVNDDPPIHTTFSDDNDRTKMVVSKIIHGFKSSVTREIFRQAANSNFGWQKSFYDHIIRNEKELNRIRKYIIENPIRFTKK